VGKDLEEQGFGGIWNVGKGAAVPPALVVLSYKPDLPEENKKNIAWVGKGIVFDTGGLCLKSRVRSANRKFLIVNAISYP
jgi:probable aminopeptidase NPEPL1